jgi:hypothetical protein
MAQPWTAKDPQAVLDYVYRIPLNAGDHVSSATPWITKLSGTVAIASQSLAVAADTTAEGYGQDVTVWLSGGTDGETCVFKAAWSTAGGRANDDIITLNVASNQIAALDLVNYTVPLPGHLTMRYPAFASVPFAIIEYWLTDAQRFVGNSWRSSDYPIALMALAAHNMSVAGLAPDTSGLQIAGGISRFKMGPMEVALTPEAANARLAADFTSTRYGVEFMTLRRANVGGPLVAPTGTPLYGAYPGVYPAGWPGWF